MDCTSFYKNQDRYFADRLDDEELNDFLSHLMNCSNCKEELEINYIVMEGIKLLREDRADYDLSAAFKRDILSMRRAVRQRKIMIRLRYIFGTAACWATLAALFVYLRVSFMG